MWWFGWLGDGLVVVACWRWHVGGGVVEDFQRPPFVMAAMILDAAQSVMLGLSLIAGIDI